MTEPTSTTESFVVDPGQLRRYADEQRASDPGREGYYARRGVTDEVEQQMRADYVRAERIRDEGLRPENSEKAEELFADADRLARRWWDHEFSEVRADWEYLTDAASDWRRSPGAMEQMYEQILIDRVDGWTEPMSEQEWRSQRQAREMAGRGQWRESRELFGVETIRSHADAERAEQAMRDDFAQVFRLHQERGDTFTDSEYMRLTEEIHGIGEQWATRTDELGETWRDMRGLAAGTYHSHSEFADAVEQIEQYRDPYGREDSPLFDRSVEQVARLKGVQRPYLSRSASHSPQQVVSSAFASARTAELRQCGRAPIPGHAFAGLVAGSEREGIER